MNLACSLILYISGVNCESTWNIGSVNIGYRLFCSESNLLKTPKPPFVYHKLLSENETWLNVNQKFSPKAEYHPSLPIALILHRIFSFIVFFFPKSTWNLKTPWQIHYALHATNNVLRVHCFNYMFFICVPIMFLPNTRNGAILMLSAPQIQKKK